MTRKRRYLISAAVLAACVGLALGVLAMLLPPQPGVTKANFDRLEYGMSKATVVEIFGREPAHLPGAGKRDSDQVYLMSRDDGAFVMMIFADGALTEMFWTDSSETFPNTISRLLNLPRVHQD
jgi:hypothetical protein